jgi:hypothetical protein
VLGIGVACSFVLFLTLIAASAFHFHLPSKFGMAMIGAYCCFMLLAVIITCVSAFVCFFLSGRPAWGSQLRARSRDVFAQARQQG